MTHSLTLARPLSASTMIAAACLLLVTLACLFGLVWSPFAPDAIDLSQRLSPPTARHWFGTDELGRDLLARIAHGAPLTVAASVATVSACAGLGVFIGGASALAPRWVDASLMRACDIMLSIPALVLAMALAAALGPGLVNALVAVIAARAPAYVRLARNQTLALRREAFVEASVSNGASGLYVLRHHIAPNILPVMLIQAVSDIGGVILATAALGFVGLGAQPPSPEWGALAASGRLFFLDCWWYAVFPGFAVVLTTLGFNLLGDAVRDGLDPRRAARP
ncbi:MAG: ABC transporter permease subunit [Alphaproteobacteria bacterium]|nr:ABC transporter permease subunit [Alphaproteobacteria bacterium]